MENDEPIANATDTTNRDRLRIFISYARSDASDFAEYLVVALKFSGFDAYLDRHDIAKGEDWEQRLGELIGRSDTVIFVITPASVKSPRCEWEVARAASLGKRLVPVQWIATPEAEVPTPLKRLNYTIFSSGQSFSAPLADLSAALRQDLAWLRKQTQLNEDAERWNRADRHDDLLLRGRALGEARTWASERNPNAPEIPAVLMAFIGASEEAETHRKSQEMRRIAEIADVQSQREKALAAAEATRYWRRVITIVSLFVVTSFAAYATFQQYKAAASEKKAIQATAVIDIIEALLTPLSVPSDIPARSGVNPPSQVTLTAILNMKRLASVDIGQKTILWFDPNPPNNQTEEGAFRKMGFDVVRATTLEEAQKLSRSKHDVVISHFGRNRSTDRKEDSNAYRLQRWRNENGITYPPIIIYSIGGTEYACSSQQDGFYDQTDDAYHLFSTVLLAIQEQERPQRC